MIYWLSCVCTCLQCFQSSQVRKLKLCLLVQLQRTVPVFGFLNELRIHHTCWTPAEWAVLKTHILCLEMRCAGSVRAFLCAARVQRCLRSRSLGCIEIETDLEVTFMQMNKIRKERVALQRRVCHILMEDAKIQFSIKGFPEVAQQKHYNVLILKY